MSKTSIANINPKILKWARESINLTTLEASKKAQVPEDKIRAWEAGYAKPTIRQARLLGNAYKRPSAFFYLDVPPKEPPDLPDFRRLPDADLRMPSELIYEIRKARYRRDVALNLYSTLDEPVPSFNFTASVNLGPNKIGQKLRSYLKIDYEVQKSWSNEYDALNSWSMAVSNVGILVFQFSYIDTSVLRGFSIGEFPLPIIALNGSDSPYGRIFTLLHEVCHLALGTGGVCDLHNSGNNDDIETFCNAVAAEILVPREKLLSNPIVVNNQDNIEWTDDQIATLSSHFRVSNEVILRRLLTLQRTTKSFYTRKREEYEEIYKKLRNTSDGFLFHHKRVLRDNGRNYTSLVLDAFQQQSISAIEVSRNLGDINLKHLADIRGELINA